MKKYLIPIIILLFAAWGFAYDDWAPGSAQREGALTDSTILTADIKDGEIVNADIDASAAILGSKLAITNLDPDMLAGDTSDDNKIDQDILEGFGASATPKITLDDSDGGDAYIDNNATGVDGVMTIGVDAGGSPDVPYVELDGVNERIEMKEDVIIEVSLVLLTSDDPDVGVPGAISHDTDGWLRVYDDSKQKGQPLDWSFTETIIQPDDMDETDNVVLWCNFSGMEAEILTIYAMADADDADFTLVSSPYTDMTDDTTIEAIQITTNSTGVYTYTIGAGAGTNIDEGSIPSGECIVFDASADDLAFVTVYVQGYYKGDVN